MVLFHHPPRQFVVVVGSVAVVVFFARPLFGPELDLILSGVDLEQLELALVVLVHLVARRSYQNLVTDPVDQFQGRFE